MVPVLQDYLVFVKSKLVRIELTFLSISNSMDIYCNLWIFFNLQRVLLSTANPEKRSGHFHDPPRPRAFSAMRGSAFCHLFWERGGAEGVDSHARTTTLRRSVSVNRGWKQFNINRQTAYHVTLHPRLNSTTRGSQTDFYYHRTENCTLPLQFELKHFKMYGKRNIINYSLSWVFFFPGDAGLTTLNVVFPSVLFVSADEAGLFKDGHGDQHSPHRPVAHHRRHAEWLWGIKPEVRLWGRLRLLPRLDAPRLPPAEGQGQRVDINSHMLRSNNLCLPNPNPPPYQENK